MALPTPEEVTALKAKHDDVYLVDFEAGSFVHRRPSQAETDEYLLKSFRGRSEEAAGNLVFSVRVWPDVEPLEAAFEEAPATVGPCAEQILTTVGADFGSIIGAVLHPLETMTDEERATVESRAGKKIVDIEGAYPRGALRYARVPSIGVSLFRRPTRLAFATYSDALKDDAQFCQAFRDISAECAVIDATKMAGVFSRYPAFSYYLGWALAAHAGRHLEVKSGKL